MAFPFDAPAVTRCNTAARKCGRSQRRYFHNRALAGAMARRAAYQITNSLLLRGGQYLSRTPSVAGNRQAWTYSKWVRIADLGAAISTVFQADSNSVDVLQWNNRTLECVIGGVTKFTSSVLFRDPSGFGHLVWNYDGNNIRAYWNNVIVGSAALTGNTKINGPYPHYIGSNGADARYLQAELSDVCFVDGQALTPSSFGEVDPLTQNWRPKALNDITWGTNGWYLGKPWNAASLGTDYSGQGNNWTPSGFAATDVLNDSPTNVYSTLNPLVAPASLALSNGNLRAQGSDDTAYVIATSTIPVPRTGKWAFKLTTVSGVDSGGQVSMGLLDLSYFPQPHNRAGATGPAVLGYSANEWAYRSNGQKKHGNAGSAYGTTWYTNNKVVECLYDADAGTLKYKVDSVDQGNAYTSIAYPSTGQLVFAVCVIGNSSVAVIDVDFGQKGYVPSDTGYKTLCTANLPATTGTTSGSFTGNVSADGPYIYTGAVPATLTINGNVVTWGTHADKLATGFKLRTSSASYNTAGTNNWTATYSGKPTVGSNKVPANAQGNP